MLLNQPQRRNGTVLLQSGQMGLPSHRLTVDRGAHSGNGLCKKKEGSKVHAGKRLPSMTSTAIPRTNSCIKWAVVKEASAIPPAYTGICGQCWRKCRVMLQPVNLLQPLNPHPWHTSKDNDVSVKCNSTNAYTVAGENSPAKASISWSIGVSSR